MTLSNHATIPDNSNNTQDIQLVNTTQSNNHYVAIYNLHQFMNMTTVTDGNDTSTSTTHINQSQNNGQFETVYTPTIKIFHDFTA